MGAPMTAKLLNCPFLQNLGLIYIQIKGARDLRFSKVLWPNRREPDSWFYIETKEAKGYKVARMRWHAL